MLLLSDQMDNWMRSHFYKIPKEPSTPENVFILLTFSIIQRFQEVSQPESLVFVNFLLSS